MDIQDRKSAEEDRERLRQLKRQAEQEFEVRVTQQHRYSIISSASARRPGLTFFRHGFPDCMVASVQPCQEIKAIDIRSLGVTIGQRARSLPSVCNALGSSLLEASA